MNKQLALLALCTALVGCGGGGSGEAAPEAEGAAPAANTETTASAGNTSDAGNTNEAAAPVSVSQMSDLVVDEGFLFTSSFPIDIEIDVSTSNPGADYVTVCLPSAATPSEPDLGNCLVRSELDGGRLASEVQVTGDTTRVFTVLWDFSNPNAPITRSFEVAPGGNPIELM